MARRSRHGRHPTAFRATAAVIVWALLNGAFCRAVAGLTVIGPTEADLRFVSNARYLLFMEVGRLELMLRTGILRHARRRGWTPLVAAQTIRYTLYDGDHRIVQ